jgi:RNA polymerase sigma factor (sigma-70 family)
MTVAQGPDRFPSTRHSLLFAVRQPELRDEALAAIVEIYWKPAYKYIRLKWNRAEDDAMDDTQDFFAGLLSRELLMQWDPARASFRTYLRLCIDSHIKNALTARTRLKRSAKMESLDFAVAERELALADPSGSPEDLFHREWQRRLFELAVSDLRTASQLDPAQALRYRVFQQYDLAADPAQRPSYEDLAREHGIPVSQVTNYLAWARRELRRLVLERLARTTSGGSEIRREARDLFR